MTTVDVRRHIEEQREYGGSSAVVPTLEGIKNERRRRSLLEYTKGSLSNYQAGWVHEDICRSLEQFYKDVKAGKQPRLMLFMPPRHGKSEIASRRFPAWVLGHDPTTEIIVSSYSADLATAFSKATKELCETVYHKGVFPKFEFGDTQKGNDWSTSNGGKYKATGVGGALSGHGSDIFIVDDPVKNWEEAYSATYREKVWNWFTSVAVTRLSPNSGILIIMTRWHDDDLSGRILNDKELSKEWKVINYPAVATKDEKYRKEGEPLHPQRYGTNRLQAIAKLVGKRVWSALYQQKPRIEGGNHCKGEWFNYIDDNKVPKGLVWRRYWDLAVKAKTSSDNSAGALGAMSKDGILYIKEITKYKKDWAVSKRIIIAKALMDRVPIGVEAVSAFEIAVVELRKELRKDKNNIVAVKGYQVSKDKLTRALPWFDLAENGRVFLVNGAWTEDFVDECEKFDPVKDAYPDDQIDAVSGMYVMVKQAWKKPKVL